MTVPTTIAGIARITETDGTNTAVWYIVQTADGQSINVTGQSDALDTAAAALGNRTPTPIRVQFPVQSRPNPQGFRRG